MSDTLVLNPQIVEEIFVDCLFRDNEDTTDHVVAEGIMMKVGFNPDRLNTHQSQIEAMLAELPDDYRESGGGGMSFLNACVDRHGNHWTGMQLTMDKLFMLGIAIGKAQYLMHRDMWYAFPGGVPYVSVSV